MRRFFLNVIIIISLFLCVSCGKEYYYMYEELNEGLQSIEIVNITSEGGSTTIETLKMLSKDEKDECLNDLTRVLIYEVLPGCNPGNIGDTLAIKLNYSSNALILSEQGIASTSSSELLVWDYPEEGAVETIISKFLD